MTDQNHQKTVAEAIRVIEQQRQYIIKLTAERACRQATAQGQGASPFMRTGFTSQANAEPLSREALNMGKTLRQDLDESFRVPLFSEAAQLIKRQQARIAELEDQLGLGDQSSPQGRRAPGVKQEAVERPSNDV